ncbi:MAG: ArsR family transcriptional regulator [Candidatus Aenigmatarchaeota archaeon]
MARRDDWYTIAYVASSKYRTEILKLLKDRPKSPSEMSKLLKCPLSRVSEALRSLERMKLITCLTPRIQKGKIYKITEMGIEILKRIET